MRRLLSSAALILAGLSLGSNSSAQEPVEIDWSGRYVAALEGNCREVHFRGLDDNKAYNLIVLSRTGGQCSFQQEGVVFRYPDFYGPLKTGKQAVFSFVRHGDEVFVTYMDRY